MAEEKRTLVGRRVKLVGDHPHRGNSGTISEDPKRLPGAGLMAKVKLDYVEGIGGVDECYAAADQLRPLPKDEEPA